MESTALAFVIHIPIILSLLIYLKGKAKRHPLNSLYYPLVFLKLAAGTAVGFIYYHYYYGGDTFLYYEDSVRLGSLCFRDFDTFVSTIFFDNLPSDYHFYYGMQPRAFFFVKILSFLSIFTFNEYWVMAAYLSLFCFAGFWRLSKVLVSYYHLPSVAVLFSLFLFPSVVFWSSGLLKESLVMGCIAYLVYYTILFVHKLRTIHWYEYALIVACIIVLGIIKYYYFAVLIPVLISYISVVRFQRKVLKQRKDAIAIVLFCIVFVVLVFLASFLHPNLSLNSFAQALYTNYIATLRVSMGRNVFIFENFKPWLSSMLPYIPKALFIGLFRPLPGDINGAFAKLTYIENFLVILFSLSAIYLWVKRKFPVSLSAVAACTYVVLLAILLTFASPNWGTLARYKVGFMPFFLLVITSFNPIFIYLSKKINL